MPSIINVVKVDVTSAQALEDVGCNFVKQTLTMPAMIAIHLLYRI